MDLSEAVYYLLDLTVVLDWTAPPGATVADWLIGPAGVVTLHTEGVRLTGVAPVFATLTLPGDPPRWVWASLGEVVREIARLARAAAQQHGQDLRPVAFIRLLPASPLTEITGAPPHIEVPRVPQFCFVDERDPLVALAIPALHLTDAPAPLRIRGAALWTDSDGRTHTTY